MEIKMDVEPSHQDWIASSHFQDVGGEIDGYLVESSLTKSEILVPGVPGKSVLMEVKKY